MNDDTGKLLEGLLGALGDNPAEKLGQILSSVSNEPETEAEENGGEEAQPESNTEGGGLDFEMLMKIQGIMSLLSGGEDDERSTLLCALKPFLSQERHQDVDRAVKLLKLSQLAKVAKEMDLFKNLL